MVREVKRKSMLIRPSGRSTDFISPSFGHGCLYECSYCYMKRHKRDGLDVAENTEDILTAIDHHSWFADVSTQMKPAIPINNEGTKAIRLASGDT